MAKFIQKAVARMKEKGTLGSFGKATPSKIARAKKEGGEMEKKAIFAENVEHKGKKKKKEKEHEKEAHKKPSRKERPMTYFGQHASPQNY